MFYSLTGKLAYKDAGMVVIECGGVGFKCATTLNTLQNMPGVGDTATLYTYLSVREDALELYGFHDMAELEHYRLITGVSGVGPKVGISIMSAFTPDKLALAISSSDAKALTAANGVGAKLAQRIVLELKDKVGGADVDSNLGAGAAGSAVGDGASQAVSALTSLGYSYSEASMAIAKLDGSMGVEELIKSALKILAGQVM